MLAKQLQKQMHLKGVSLAQLSRLSGVAKPTIHGWLTGRKPMDLNHLRSVARTLEISVHELLYGEPDPYASCPDLTEIFYGDIRITVHRIERLRG
jgi:transcriptional regulator with XRE-family HTH domain